MKANKSLVWTTGSGERVRIKNMTDGHLMNTIRYIRRVAASQEMVCYDCTHRVLCAHERIIEPEEVSSMYVHMVREAKRRKKLCWNS